MIRINAVSRTGGQVVLTVEYTTGNGNAFVDVDAEEVVNRLRQLRDLVGRKPTLAEAQEVLVQLINEVRSGGDPVIDVIPWEDYIGIDLEA